MATGTREVLPLIEEALTKEGETQNSELAKLRTCETLRDGVGLPGLGHSQGGLCAGPCIGWFLLLELDTGALGCLWDKAVRTLCRVFAKRRGIQQ